MLTIAKGRPIEIKCYATDSDGNENIAEVSEVRASLAGTAVIVGPDYITREQDIHGDTFYRLRFVKWYTIKKLNPCAYTLRLTIGDKKMRIKDIFAIDTYAPNDNTGLPPTDAVIIRLTIRETPTGSLTWAEDITVPGTLQAIRVNGGSYTMEEGVIVLPDYPSRLEQLEGDSTHRTVTDTERLAWNAILDKIPEAASAQNELADKSYVRSKIDEASPVFRGTNITATTEADLLEWASELTHNLNDYIMWRRTDAEGNISYRKYRYDGEQWAFEFQINSNSFTSEQWAAINSGITDEILQYLLETIAEAVSEDEFRSALALKLDKFSMGAHDLPVWFDSNKEPQVIDSLHTPGDIQSDSNVEALGGVAAHGHADMSMDEGGSDSDSVKAIKVGEGGSPITPDNGIVTLPSYPSTLAELTPDSQHQTVTSTEKADWNDVLDKIPAEATSSNKLADKNYVDTQMASASGTFRGTNTTATTEQELIAWADTLQHNVNDYVFWQKSDAYGNTYFSRYKYDGTTWLYEYDITSTSFTEEQWNAINSGITARHLDEIDASILALLDEMDNKADKDDLTPVVDALGQHASELEDHSELINENSKRIEDLQRDVISQGEMIERSSGYIQGLQSDVALINQRLDYDSLPLFDPNKQDGYIRGDVVKIVDSGGNAFGYRFIMSHTGAWVEAHCEPLNIWALANPLDIDDTRLNEIINS